MLIYIPFCYYSYYVCALTSKTSTGFTFHSVTILIKRLNDLEHTSTTFTFHSVTILIRKPKCAVKLQVDLHSILLLFLWGMLLELTNESRFTFHSVTILMHNFLHNIVRLSRIYIPFCYYSYRNAC